MSLLEYLLTQVEILLGRKLSDSEKEYAERQLADHATALEKSIASAAKNCARKIIDSRN